MYINKNPLNPVQIPEFKRQQIKTLNIYLTGFGNLLANQTRYQKTL